MGFESGSEFFEFLLTGSDEDIEKIEPVMQKLVKWKEVIDEEKKKNMVYYKIFWVLKGRILDNIFMLIEKMKSYVSCSEITYVFSHFYYKRGLKGQFLLLRIRIKIGTREESPI